MVVAVHEGFTSTTTVTEPWAGGWTHLGAAVTVVDPEAHHAWAQTENDVAEPWWIAFLGLWVNAGGGATVLLRREQIWRRYLATPRLVGLGTSPRVGGPAALGLVDDTPTVHPRDPDAFTRYPASWTANARFSPSMISYIDSKDGGRSFRVEAPRSRPTLDSTSGAVTGWDTANADWTDAGWSATGVRACPDSSSGAVAFYTHPSVLDLDALGAQDTGRFVMVALKHPATVSPRCGATGVVLGPDDTWELGSALVMLVSDDAEFNAPVEFVLKQPRDSAVSFGRPQAVTLFEDANGPARIRVYVPWQGEISWLGTTLVGDGVSILEVYYVGIERWLDGSRTPRVRYVGEFSPYTGGVSPSVAQVDGVWVTAGAFHYAGAMPYLSPFNMVFMFSSEDGLTFGGAVAGGSMQVDAGQLRGGWTDLEIWDASLTFLLGGEAQLTYGLLRGGYIGRAPIAAEVFDGWMAASLSRELVLPTLVGG